jgi:sulfoxide reductase heme-binding subunit YedZ
MQKKRRPIKWHRIKQRLRRHHLPLLLFTVLSVALFYWIVKAEDVLFRFSMATAYPGMALLAATLFTGPLKVLRKQAIPVSDDLTRDLGIWAAIVSLIHVVFGLQMHMRGRMWLLFVTESLEFPFVRFDQFGAANYTGLIGTIIIVLLLALSNDLSLRKLGTKKWKQLQRWNYGLFLLIVVHGVIYQILEKRVQPYPYLFASIGVVILIVQLTGFVYRKRQLV